MTLRTFCVTDQHVKHKYMYFLAVSLPIVQERIALSVSRKALIMQVTGMMNRKTPTKNKKLLDAGTSSMNHLT